MTTTIEALKIRVKDRYRVKKFILHKDTLQCVLRGDYRLVFLLEYIANQDVKVLRQLMVKPTEKLEDIEYLRPKSNRI